MSDAMLAVRFPDGEIRHGVYAGSSDTARPRLYDSADEAWTGRRVSWPDITDELRAAAVDVEIASDYGGGFWWRGKATREFIVEGYAPWGLEGWGHVIEPPCEITDGHPDWWGH